MTTNNVMTLDVFAELINNSDEWKTSFNEIIEKNGWEDLTDDEFNICRDGNKLLTIDENGQAVIIEDSIEN